MRMRIFKSVPQGQEAYLFQREVFFSGVVVVGEGGGFPSTFTSTFKIEVSSCKYCFKISGLF